MIVSLKNRFKSDVVGTSMSFSTFSSSSLFFLLLSARSVGLFSSIIPRSLLVAGGRPRLLCVPCSGAGLFLFFLGRGESSSSSSSSRSASETSSSSWSSSAVSSSCSSWSSWAPRSSSSSGLFPCR